MYFEPKHKEKTINLTNAHYQNNGFNCNKKDNSKTSKHNRF